LLARSFSLWRRDLFSLFLRVYLIAT